MDDRIVFCVFTKEGVKYFDSPKLAREVTCPLCGGSEYFISPKEKCWHCASPGCFVFNKKEGFVFICKSILEFGVPEDFINSSVKVCDQSNSVMASLKSYSEKPNGLLTLFGTSGNGKTTTACSILEAYRLRGGIRARFVSMPDFFSKWKECIYSKLSERPLIEPFVDSEMLVLDDLGTKEPTVAFLELIFLIIDKRPRKFSTIITTNLDISEMKSCLGDRILSRIGGGMLLRFSGKDKRYT